MNLVEFRLKFNLHSLHKSHHLPASHQFDLSKPLRKAAVLIALSLNNGELELLLTRRPTHLRSHPGQISFPGGKVEEFDTNLEATALREAQEEIGLLANNVDVLGLLHDHKTFTGFDITPVVSIVKQPFTPIIDPGEVDELFTIPLSFLLDKDNRHTQYFSRKGIEYPIHFIPYKSYFIWGATAAMIDQLCQLIAHHDA
ncbi:CoA pyrophosphatase [Shewanella sp. KX20019]|uniref:CoA pyrophosphatase n=1 Tax=Shewanella sp. KX20019 TaxID=2803864 RepID=UPI001926F93B|nr:CoA pyrophosphatase [Shewanella sp. KX20019]QQX82326.1 CoA pyrophosphatase [Shewanella sp. KX20019]